MKVTFLSAFFLFQSIFFLSAQSDKCYTDHAVDRLRANNPAYNAAMDAWRNAIQQIALQTPPANGSRGQVYVIPIVFHVILPSQALLNSVTDLEIQQQVATLNEDFRKQNADISTVRAIFTSLASDIEVEFCLATRDPSGNAANGITRTITAQADWDPSTESDDMKDDATGGHDAWNPLKYVNVWIVDIAGSQFGGTAGYAYIGSNGIHGDPVDGIVLDFTLGFGPNNRSLSHEMGHYFGLYHIWGVSGGCSDDDGISDTPESSTANFNCDFNTNSCNTGAGDQPDMVENYMDYSDCPVMFSAGQKTVMRTILTGVRGSLITNNLGCQSVNSPPVANFSASVTAVCTGGTVSFTDISSNLPTSWSWTFTGGTPSSSTQQNPTVTYSTAGTYTVTLTATNSFGSDGETKTAYITVGTGGTQTIFSEDFEGSFPGSWTFSNPDNALTWEVVTIAGSLPGSKAARVNIFNYNARGQRDGLISPIIDLSGNTQIILTFNYAHRRYSQNEHDSLIVRVSTNGGSTWPYKVYANAEDNNAGAVFATGGLLASNFVPATSGEWCAASATGVTCPVIDLAAFSGQANFRLKFEVYNDYGNNIYVDNIVLTGVCSGATGQAPAANFTANQTTGCGSVTASFSDQSTNTPSSWSWQFTGGTPATSTQQNPTVTYSTAGTYSVTLTAANANGNNSKTVNGYITVYSIPTANASATNASCAGAASGTVNLTVSGGTSPYNYNWSNGNTTQDLTAVSAGNYSVTVTDANSCTKTAAATVSQPSALATSATTTGIPCGGGSGSVDLTVSGGTSPYTYNWSNGSVSQDLTAVNAGNYSVTVTDAGSCTKTESATVSQSSNISATASITDASCSGANNGSIDMSVSGGTAPFTYLWSNGAITQDAANLVAGNYLVTITDQNGCVKSEFFTVEEDAAITLNATIRPDSTGAATGSISVKPLNGTEPYTFQWSTGSNSEEITGLSAGSYSLTVTDAAGCAATGTYTVTIDTSHVSVPQVPDAGFLYRVFPNPTGGVLNVSIKANGEEAFRLILYNSIGQQLLQRKFERSPEVNTSFDMSGFEPGIYFVRMESGGKAAVSRVVVVKE